ncbi:hypothetical protein HUJ04_011365 [Dendroctonus ponderosae]|nr:hypothetical protein HUJ04_011365 [Dendroctonus ponderosae]
MNNIPHRLLTSFIWVNKLHSVPPCDVAKVFSREYGIFVIWKDKNAIANINETVFLAYFQELYSILRSTLIVYENIDISEFQHLVSFRQSKESSPKDMFPRSRKFYQENKF